MYKTLKVHWVNAVTQNGNWVNKRIRHRHPAYKSLKPGIKQVKKLIAKTYIFERFHLMLFAYFLLLTAHALIVKQYWWAFGLIVANVIYNVYPNLLQQYIRLRLKIYLRRRGLSA